jgi:hypothetical protein
MRGRGGYEVLTMRSASALRFSKGCSSLNLDRMLSVCMGMVCICWESGLLVVDIIAVLLVL